MINFRFHLASLIAIFLALALGVVVGAGVIDRGVVDTLNSRLDNVERESDRIRGENSQLRNENNERNEAIQALTCPAVDNRLLATDVAVVALRGVSEDTVQQTMDAAGTDCGGGSIDGVLWLEGKWALDSEDDVKAMADLLGVSSRRPAMVRAAAWKQLAERMQSGPIEIDGASDLLTTMEDAEFVPYQPVGGDQPVAQFPSRGASTLFVMGSDADVPDGSVVLPAATAFHDAGVPLVMGDVYVQSPDGPGRGSVFSELRSDDALAKSVSTVDNLDTPEGPATAVLALAALQQVPPIVDHYGIEGNALLPAPQ
jgi:Copper transport outer membrane protein, MctB